MSPDPLRIALLTYRGNPHSGGQGVYVRYLSRALVELGHRVEVMSGQPYPELDPGVVLTPLASLDLYRPDDPFRTPRLSEFRDWIDVLEYAAMCTAAFPEPLTFSLRAARYLREHHERFDVVHDNQCLGYGLLDIQRRIPLVTTIHHPVTIDARLEKQNAPPERRLTLMRWYAFTRMQRRVARRLRGVITASGTGRDDAVEEFGLAPERVSVVHNGVDTDLFKPVPDQKRVPGRLITTTSADVPIKGLAYLIEALAKLRTEHDAHLIVVGKPRKNVQAAIERFGMQPHVRFETKIDSLRIVELYASSEVAIIPSLYEGFSLPAAEAMACEVPVVATTGGALPEVIGTDGDAGLLVEPRDASALANAIGRLLDQPALAASMGAAGRARVLERFTWRKAAERTVAEYRKVMS
ncbi:MAG TPA: glycosyltransferase family 4 protein [Actinomycetota bacterium]|nr:glycosyltransferase family 4 protein [Actinomycetota bacterium]